MSLQILNNSKIGKDKLLNAEPSGQLLENNFQDALNPLQSLWQQLKATLPDRVLSEAAFSGLDSLFRNVLTERNLEILCGDLLRVAQSAFAWEELHGFCEQVLSWVLGHTQEKSLQVQAERVLRQIENRPDSIKEGIFFLAHDLARHPVRAELVVGMGMAGLGIRLGRLAGAAFSRARGFGVLGKLAAQGSFGLVGELSAFSVGTRSAQLYQGKAIDWSATAIGTEMLSGFFLMGPMKLSAPLARAGRATGALKFLQAGTAHYLGAASGTYASALVHGQTLNGYQIFSGATHLMMEGAMASSVLKAGLPRLEAVHRALEIKTHQMIHHSFSQAASRVKPFWQRPLGEMQLDLQQARMAADSGEMGRGVDSSVTFPRGLSIQEGGRVETTPPIKLHKIGVSDNVSVRRVTRTITDALFLGKDSKIMRRILYQFRKAGTRKNYQGIPGFYEGLELYINRDPIITPCGRKVFLGNSHPVGIVIVLGQHGFQEAYICPRFELLMFKRLEAAIRKGQSIESLLDENFSPKILTNAQPLVKASLPVADWIDGAHGVPPLAKFAHFSEVPITVIHTNRHSPKTHRVVDLIRDCIYHSNDLTGMRRILLDSRRIFKQKVRTGLDPSLEKFELHYLPCIKSPDGGAIFMGNSYAAGVILKFNANGYFEKACVREKFSPLELNSLRESAAIEGVSW